MQFLYVGVRRALCMDAHTRRNNECRVRWTSSKLLKSTTKGPFPPQRPVLFRIQFSRKRDPHVIPYGRETGKGENYVNVCVHTRRTVGAYTYIQTALLLLYEFTLLAFIILCQLCLLP